MLDGGRKDSVVSYDEEADKSNGGSLNLRVTKVEMKRKVVKDTI